MKEIKKRKNGYRAVPHRGLEFEKTSPSDKKVKLKEPHVDRRGGRSYINRV